MEMHKICIYFMKIKKIQPKFFLLELIPEPVHLKLAVKSMIHLARIALKLIIRGLNKIELDFFSRWLERNVRDN